MSADTLQVGSAAGTAGGKRREARGPLGVKPTAVIIGLDSMQGLQVARILAGHGVPVVGVSRGDSHYANRTNSCGRVLVTNTGTERLVATLLELRPDLVGSPVLIPCQDKNVLVVSEHRETLEAAGYTIVLPPDEVVRRLADKSTFAAYAASIGLRIPPSYRVADRTELEGILDELVYPAVLKPAHRSRAWLKHTRAKAIRAESADELRAVYDRVGDWVPELVVQQWVEGPESNLYSFNGYYDRNSELLVGFTARKLRQYPPGVGQSCYGEEVRADELVEAAELLFRSAGMVGLAYLEMKRDERTGEFFAIEPNIGRPTGRSAIAEAGGVALHYTAYCDAAGLPLPPNRTQTYTGARWIHLLRDMQTSAHYLRSGQLTVRQWLSSLRGRKAYAVFSLRDPRPFLGAIVEGLRGAASVSRTRQDKIEV